MTDGSRVLGSVLPAIAETGLSPPPMTVSHGAGHVWLDATAFTPEDADDLALLIRDAAACERQSDGPRVPRREPAS